MSVSSLKQLSLFCTLLTRIVLNMGWKQCPCGSKELAVGKLQMVLLLNKWHYHREEKHNNSFCFSGLSYVQVCYYADIVYLQDLKQMQPCRIASEIICSLLSLQDAKHYLLSYINIPYIPNQIPTWVQNDLPCFAYKFLCFIFSIKSPIWSIHTVLNNSKCLQQQQAQL